MLPDFKPRTYFLIDGTGALISALVLGVVMPAFEAAFGMPRQILYFLACLACLFSVYSFSCFFLFMKNWRPFLKRIAVVNLLYCCLTLGLVIWRFAGLTLLGILYFALEILIVVILSVSEWRTAYFSRKTL